MQAFLLLSHWFIFHTWIVFASNLSPAVSLPLRATLFLLTFGFVPAALLGFRFSSFLITSLYKIAAIWLGFLNYFFLAACLCRLLDFAFRLAAVPTRRPMIAGILFSLAFLTGIYGLLNALWIRIHRVPIRLPNLPASWRGRTALVFSDLHLGNVNGFGFCRRVVNLAARIKPDIILIPGDFFDGVRLDPARLAAPFGALSPPFGIYFVTGNHDEYGDLSHYLEALKAAGIHILNDERVTVDGLPIVGIPYRETTHLLQMRATLESLHTSAGEASILLSHVPNRLPIVEQAGFALQLSGHTHGGQLFPFTWFTRRAFGKFTYGLQRFGQLQVYTSSGAGTWGPPMRVGTHSELVLLEFE
jgi:uncharacterized protein